MAIGHNFGKRSRRLMEDMHPDLQRVFRKALIYSPYDFGVTEVLRSEAQQRENMANKVSWSMKTKHFRSPDGWVRAGDIVVYVDGVVTWEKGVYRKVIQAFIRAAIEEGVQVEFGGLWRSVEDCPHIQLADYK